ncbi:uncharacterized protein LOC107710205 [Sinocyclocheilus rhinocerous]|uniref:uncharacterized protein LOC107710205 n=1 Tax=Sinocyclocheilus rhinocerous TaxID=307959 RepID=UPI0007B8FBDC|nr:PREDICTED: uncharacterized protein LOC107710205 [Sinocyclocheilus rhinocerous]
MIRTFVLLCLVGFLQAESYEVQSVMVGEPVTLNSNTFEIQLKNEIEWRFNNSRIAKAMNGNPTYDKNERFKDRLKLERNGSLTITNTRTTDTGVYKFSTIINGKDSSKTFSVTVYAPVSSIPVITSVISQCSSSPENSSSPKCVLLCSVMNVSRVTLSWYKGNGSLSSINVSDLSISLSLPLEVEYQDKNTYSCVVSNPISYKTRHACITDLCRLCSEEVSCCESTEAVIRLAVTALVGLAAAAAFIVLVYDIRSRRVEQERHQTQSDGPDTLKQEKTIICRYISHCLNCKKLAVEFTDSVVIAVGCDRQRTSSQDSNMGHQRHSCTICVLGDRDAVKSVSVMEGESVTLDPELTDIQSDEEIEWRFGDIRIARVLKLHPQTPSVSLTVLISAAAAAGTLLILAAVGIFCICRKHRKTDQQVQTRDEEITYADPTFYKRYTQKAKEEDEVVYARVVTKR